MTMRRMSEIVRHQNPLMLSQRTTVKRACACMHERRVGAVLVTGEGGRLVGIFTGRDAVARVVAQAKDAATTTLADVMTPNPLTMAPDKTAIDALRLMHEGGFRHVPVVCDGQVLGVVSHGDFRGLEHDRLDDEMRLWERL